MKRTPLIRFLVAGACAALFVTQLQAADLPPVLRSSATAEGGREHLSLDLNWKFHLGDDWPNASDLSHLGTSTGPITERFNDSAWRPVNLPHDWGIELPFDRNGDKDHGYRPLGRNFPSNSIAWYRRAFELPPSDSGRRIWLTFDGAFRDTTVWVNGWLVRRHEGGYNPFREDITDVVHFGGRNTIAVRVDATKFEGWFYEGAGIYRHVWLDKTAPVAIAPDGIFVSSRPPNGCTVVEIQAQIQNTKDVETYEDYNVYVNFEIIDPSGKSVGEIRQRVGQPVGKDAFGKDNLELKANSQQQIKAYLNFYPPNSPIRMPSPTPNDQTKDVFAATELWSPESPKLYKLITTVEIMGGGVLMGSGVVDRQETAFGIRTVAFDPNIGFLLNGKRYELQGVCIHQDWPGVGVAVPDSLQRFRVSRLKEMGCNAIRTAHNPPAPGFLDACDELGMLVMDEHRLPGGDTESLRKWDDQIRRDRNHPSVAIWSLGNEERGVEDTPQGANVARSMQDLVRRLDPTRPVTYAAPEGNVFRGINSVIEVRGWNYYLATNNTDRYHAEHPTQPEVCTEQGSIVSTRGIYANDRQRGYISSYDTNWPGWTPPNAMWLWSYVAARPWLSGVFVWAGFDYAGEPSPNSWPNINSQFGILDRCGFPKDTFYYYQSWWQTNPVLHLLPHWNWPGREGQDIRVVAYSNCRQVELLLNGVSLGRRVMAANSDLAWQVKYAPGTLSAKGFDDAGKVIAETKVETTGEPVSIQLTPAWRGERPREPEPTDAKRLAGTLAPPTLRADGEDVAVFTVSALDAQGRVVPVAQNKINFSIEGAGKIIGVGNGDPACHEPDTFVAEALPRGATPPSADQPADATTPRGKPQWSRSLFNGLAQIIVQSTRDTGGFRLTAGADGLAPATAVVQTQPCTPRPAAP